MLFLADNPQKVDIIHRTICFAYLFTFIPFIFSQKFSDFVLGYTHTASFSIKYTIASMVYCSPLPNLVSASRLRKISRGIGASQKIRNIVVNNNLDYKGSIRRDLTMQCPFIRP